MREYINIIESAAVEANAGDVYDILHVFADRQESVGGSFNEIYVEDNQSYPQLFMGGYPEDGFGLEAALKIIEPLVAELQSKGWFLAKKHVAQNMESHEEYLADDPDYDYSPQLLIYFGFFPERGEREIIPHAVFHISPTVNREQITREGIKARNGGSDFIHTSVGRVYVILDDIHIESVIKDIQKHRTDPVWNDLDVWVIDAWEMPDEWHVDVELEGVAAWTTYDIPPRLISLYK